MWIQKIRPYPASAAAAMSVPVTLALTILLFFLVSLSGCHRTEAIPVGFAGELTGPRADLGVAGRDGAQLAVEIINDSGGINGRPIALIVKNDRGDPARARQVDEELIEQGVVAIIGHMTSAQTAAVWDTMNQAEVVLLGPGASSSQFDGKDDYLFRVNPSTDPQARALARHVYETGGVRQLTGIYDLGNRAYAETLWRTVQTEFESLGGDAGQEFTFTSGETDLPSLMAEVAASRPEAVVFIAPSVDTALMVQYGRQQGLTAKLFSSGWAGTEVFLEKGGRAIEGVELVLTFSDQHSSPAFKEFVRRFKTHYGYEPNFSAAYSYEAVLVLAHALQETNGQADGLPDALKKIKNLEVLQGKISLDQYGDVNRDVYIAGVKNRQFEILYAVMAATR